jgi:SAM-dependent methyltransferase
MTKAACPLCGAQENARRFSERHHDVLVCGNCGLHFIHPYRGDAHEEVPPYDYDRLKFIDPARHYASSKSYYKRKYLSYVVSECGTAQSILDIGCGTGALLELLHDENPNIRMVGIELNKERAEFAESVCHCDVYQVGVEEFNYDGRFDVITMINVLSHIPSFDGLFASIRKLLATDGKVILKVGELTDDVRKGAMFDWCIPDHLHFLGVDTIRFICAKYGFRVIGHEREPFSADLFAVRRWLAPGRSAIRSTVKRAVALTPFALWMLRKLYDVRYGGEAFSSFIVIGRAEA